MASRAPKIKDLTENETLSSFNNWRQILLYSFSLESQFAEFLAEGATWERKTANGSTRGLEDDTAGDNKRTKQQKALSLEIMLGQIANHCPISRNIITRNCTCLGDVWQQIRQYYGFQTTGFQILNLSDFKQEDSERPEALFHRLYEFFEDNLLTKSCGIKHHGEVQTKDEEMSPTLENTIVWLWLKLLHPGLPAHVSIKYGPELRDKTVSSIRSEISTALPALMNELATSENAKVFRTGQFQKPYGFGNSYQKQSRSGRSYQKQSRSSDKNEKVCDLCTANNRPANHFLSKCHYLREGDKRMFSRARFVTEMMNGLPTGTESDDDDYDDDGEVGDNEGEPFMPPAQPSSIPHVARRVTSEASGVLECKYKDKRVDITIDSGATSNMIQASFAKRLGIKIHQSVQHALQADGRTPLTVLGEVHTSFTRGSYSFPFDGLVIKELEVNVLGGTPFMSLNDIAIRPYNSTIIIKWQDVIKYTAIQVPLYSSNVRRTQSFILRGLDRKTVILPGESLALPAPACLHAGEDWAIEPRCDSKCSWVEAQIVKAGDGSISLTNVSDEPVVIDKHAHVCHVRSIVSINNITSDSAYTIPEDTKCPDISKPFSSSISVDPNNIVSTKVQARAHDIHGEYDEVFSPDIHMYNGFSGKIEGNVNIGPVLPPQHKAQMPHYNQEKLANLQQQFDILEKAGVFRKPEEVGVVAEYINMSFLVPKKDETGRLVTSFGPVAQFSKPQPSIMPNVDGTIRQIGQWKYLIKSDLSKAYYQIPLNKESMKFCGVATPFRGVRVYARCAMGMPGSETALEELMNRILGHLVQIGVVAKIADDLYCGGDTPEQALDAWECVLKLLHENGLGLSATKTVVFPQSTVVLGWIWSSGTIQASPHRVSALSIAEPPQTVRALRSFIGAYKVLSRVIKGYADLLHPLDQVVAGRNSSEKIEWSDELLHQFKKLQESLKDCKIITLPRHNDELYIVTDGAQLIGIASTLWILRDGELKLGGFFNAQLKKGQTIWLPCEVEALCIGASTNHFAPYIIQSQHRTNILTDNKPCVQAYNKMCRGSFSHSARVLTFLNAAGRYNVSISHISGAKIPLTDYSSRHPVQCDSQSCQICQFVADTSDCVVRRVSVESILKGDSNMPFVSRPAWLATQQDCPDLRRVYAQLKQGTRPSKKMTKIPNIKRYLRNAVIARDGVLVVKESIPFQGTVERIIVPQNVIYGLVTATHLRLDHPTSYQLKRVLSRYFYAISLDNIVEEVTKMCHICNSLMSIPLHLVEQSSSDPPPSIGTFFAADVMKRNKQLVFIIRETVSSYTATKLIHSESKDDQRDALIILLLPFKSSSGTIRIDSGPGLAGLIGDSKLSECGLQVEAGRVKNINKNPVGEKAVEELGDEILKLQPRGGPISEVLLARATAVLNSRIRRDGLSSREIWTQRDMITGKQLCLSDKKLIDNQHQSRIKNHSYSAKSKARVKVCHPAADIHIGSLVYIINEGDKTQSREKYMVISIDGEWCKVRKLTDLQFRTKPYELKLSEVFPVTEQARPTESNSIAVGSDSDSSDWESVHDNDEQNQDAIENGVSTPLRRSTRERRRPDFYDNPVSEF